ncbi:MipA/OmpV family protein [Oceanicoccus sagamiensis]|uniref:MipA/OmpV family protein n=1 Tax=Oceanicoccus sagamiensis TaxID=716816 RepID=A0A1X9N7W0_9GAMM|nr:MipA/OmpV family protein [Oceanicoccus sagamiensis]ARN73194.1 hypothetical protein BST96_03180 [Oceanicoccus sagamiensis]
MSIRPLLVFIFSYLLLAPLPSLARDVSQLHLEPGDGNWSLGFGLRNATFPYIGTDEETDFVPLITYNGQRYFIDGTRAGIHLLNNQDWLISGYAAYRYGGFNEEDSDELDGMDRDDSVDGRLAITRRTPYGRFTLDTGGDINSKSEGWDAQIRWGEIFERGNYRFRPWIGLTYEDEKLANYYYGVRPEEAEADRPAYEVDSTVEMSYGIDMSYRFFTHHYIGLNFQYSELDDSKRNSPITNESGVFESMFSYRYEFNDFQASYNPDSGFLDDLSEGEWYWRAAAGLTTRSKFNELVRFSNFFNNDERNTGLASLFVGKKITDRFMHLPLEGYVTGGYVRRLENGEQSDFNEYVLGFKAYFTQFPWSDTVKTRVGLGEGISYAEKIPIVEKENVEGKNRSTSHMLNYIDWSWDVSIGDVFNKPDLKECYMGWSIHHRSGIFGSSDFFGNVDGGGNVNTLYIQCHNTGK